MRFPTAMAGHTTGLPSLNVPALLWSPDFILEVKFTHQSGISPPLAGEMRCIKHSCYPALIFHRVALADPLHHSEPGGKPDFDPGSSIVTSHPSIKARGLQQILSYYYHSPLLLAQS